MIVRRDRPLLWRRELLIDASKGVLLQLVSEKGRDKADEKFEDGVT